MGKLSLNEEMSGYRLFAMIECLMTLMTLSALVWIK